MSFAKNLKEMMNAKGISQAELADFSHVSKSGISQYLSGKVQPKERIINKLAIALDCSADYLMRNSADDMNDAATTNNVSVEQAAKMLGKSKQFVRVALQKGIVPFGFAVKMSSKYTYHISPKKLNEYIKNGC